MSSNDINSVLVVSHYFLREMPQGWTSLYSLCDTQQLQSECERRATIKVMIFFSRLFQCVCCFAVLDAVSWPPLLEAEMNNCVIWNSFLIPTPHFCQVPTCHRQAIKTLESKDTLSSTLLLLSFLGALSLSLCISFPLAHTLSAVYYRRVISSFSVHHSLPGSSC